MEPALGFAENKYDTQGSSFNQRFDVDLFMKIVAFCSCAQKLCGGNSRQEDKRSNKSVYLKKAQFLEGTHLKSPTAIFP